MFKYKQSSLISLNPGIKNSNHKDGCMQADRKRFANQGYLVSKYAGTGS